jgi:hypothetical protein
MWRLMRRLMYLVAASAQQRKSRRGRGRPQHEPKVRYERFQPSVTWRKLDAMLPKGQFKPCTLAPSSAPNRPMRSYCPVATSISATLSLCAWLDLIARPRLHTAAHTATQLLTGEDSLKEIAVTGIDSGFEGCLPSQAVDLKNLLDVGGIPDWVVVTPLDLLVGSAGGRT